MAALQERLQRREQEVAQLRSDLEIACSDSAPGEVSSDLKQRLMELSKRNRRLQVTADSQRARVAQLEAELKRPREEVKRRADELAAEQTAQALGDGCEDWKRKFLASANKLQEARQEAQELRLVQQRQRRVLLKELGSEDSVEKALQVADDPEAKQWRGRAQQIAQLQRQLREARERQLPEPKEPSDRDVRDGRGSKEEPVPCEPSPQRKSKPLGAGAVAQAAERRREEFDKLQDEAERLRQVEGDSRRKRVALRSRVGVLEGQLRELKAHVQTLLDKAENDDALVAALRRQAGRGSAAQGEELRAENAELQAQLEKQAQQLLLVRQRSLQSSVESGQNARLGPGPIDASQLQDRVRYLEVENQRQAEMLRMHRDSRPGSGASGRSGALL